MFAHVDCNNFFVSCERVFDSSLDGKPVIVLSNNDGCAIARSNEAKAIGIRMGAPAFEIEDIIKKHDVKVLSTNFVLYADMSLRVKRMLYSFCPEVEDYSIDEVFLNFYGFKDDGLRDYCLNISETVKQGTGIPISIGVAPTKTLAKVATAFAKKYKGYKTVCVIDTEEKRVKALKKTDISDVWGIGRQHTKRLRRMGVSNAYDFAELPQHWVRKNMTIVGEKTWLELNGTPCIDMELTPPDKKSITVSRSFGKMIQDYDTIAEAVSTYASMATSKLRRQGSCAGTIHVFLHTNPFREDLPQYFRSVDVHLPVPSSSSIEIIKYAKEGLAEIYRKGYHYKKAGIILMDIIKEDFIQGDIFDDVDREKHRKIMQILDKINGRYGRNTLGISAQGDGKSWKIKQEKLTPSYTTRLSDFPKVK